jgi:transcriptional regulator with XRE-family HTH domain
MDHISWIRQGLAKPRKTQTALARHLGISQSQISRMLRGERRLQISELQRISDYLEEPVPLSQIAPTPFSGRVVPMVGVISDGAWQDASIPFKSLDDARPAAPTKRFEGVPQSCFRLDQDIPGHQLKAGATIYVVPYVEARDGLKDGKLYVLSLRQDRFVSWVLTTSTNGKLILALTAEPLAATENCSIEFLVIGVFHET